MYRWEMTFDNNGLEPTVHVVASNIAQAIVVAGTTAAAGELIRVQRMEYVTVPRAEGEGHG